MKKSLWWAFLKHQWAYMVYWLGHASREQEVPSSNPGQVTTDFRPNPGIHLGTQHIGQFKIMLEF